MSRITHVYLLSLAAVCCVSAVGCSSSNEPATTSPAGAGAPTTSGGAGAPASGGGGAPSVAGAGAAGAATVGGSPGVAAGGSTTSEGGASTGTGGGTVASGGASTGAGMYTPLCSAVPLTAAGVAPTKAGACTATDSQLCYKTCGPASTGYKSETCTAGVYQEQSGCSFPADVDYSCYKIPTTYDATCPTTTITASTACTVGACITCSDATGHYYDSTNTSKVGDCTCPAAGASGTSKWSCASSTAWPCPTGKGC
jgi:hypothetical protein